MKEKPFIKLELSFALIIMKKMDYKAYQMLYEFFVNDFHYKNEKDIIEQIESKENEYKKHRLYSLISDIKEKFNIVEIEENFFISTLEKKINNLQAFINMEK